MPFLTDLSVAALPGATSDEKLESLIRQINEWGRLLSNEALTTVYRDNSGTPRIIIGVCPDGETDIVISEEGTSVLDVFA